MTNNKPASRDEALQWLVANVDEWPMDRKINYSAPAGWYWHWLGSDPCGEWKLFSAVYFSIGQSDWLAAQSKSEAPVWNGEGLPPVGLQCICTPHNSTWGFPAVSDYTGHVLAYDADYFWWHDGSVIRITSRTDKVDFMPIKSEAERRRESAIDELRDLIESSDADGYNYGGLAAVIYDAGWRKLEDGHDSNG